MKNITDKLFPMSKVHKYAKNAVSANTTDANNIGDKIL